MSDIFESEFTDDDQSKEANGQRVGHYNDAGRGNRDTFVSNYPTQCLTGAQKIQACFHLRKYR